MGSMSVCYCTPWLSVIGLKWWWYDDDMMTQRCFKEQHICEDNEIGSWLVCYCTPPVTQCYCFKMMMIWWWYDDKMTMIWWQKGASRNKIFVEMTKSVECQSAIAHQPWLSVIVLKWWWYDDDMMAKRCFKESTYLCR